MDRGIISEVKPLLSDIQLKFLKSTFSQIEEAIRKRESVPRLQIVNKEAEEFIEKIKVIEENLRTIINRLNSARYTKEKFIKGYKKWKKIRSDAIHKLKEIADTINLDRFNCNVSKLVGYSFSAAGGILTVGSAVLTALSFGLATPLLVGSVAVTAAGISTTIGTSTTEFILLKNKIEEAKKIVKKDKEYFEEMSDWLEHSHEMEDAVESILKMDVVSDLARAVVKFVEDAMNIPSEFKRLNFIREKVTTLFKFIPEPIKSSISMTPVGSLIVLLVIFCLLLKNKENRLVFDWVSATTRGILGVVSLFDDAMDMMRLANLFKCSTVAAKAATRGTLAVFGLAFDIAGITLTSIDVHKGSISPQATQIRNASEEMEKEAEVLEKVYKKLSDN